ncbi:XdhC family protein [Maricurvus nonylphenolicus]|uniref:XdhC family protein n=1 Tax=Maricurvus nonylphenolicus TaxID=1008307 RepID=UPI0036F35258
MLSSQYEVLSQARDSLLKGNKVTLVTVIKTWGTSPRPIGSLLCVSSCGQFCGSVSGGCIEDDLLDRLISNPPQNIDVIKYGETAEERHRFGLPCGGTVELLLEPLNQTSDLDLLLNTIEARKVCMRITDIESSEVSIKPCHSGFTTPSLNNESWTNIIGPAWRIFLVGAGDISRFLADMAVALNYQVIVCDPRPSYRSGWDTKKGVIAQGYPDDALQALEIDSRTAVVALSHDPKLDDLAIMEALRSDAFYVGVMGSQRTNDARRQRLMEYFEFSQEELSRLKGPVGISIGSKTPAEIALSVLADITSIKNSLD